MNWMIDCKSRIVLVWLPVYFRSFCGWKFACLCVQNMDCLQSGDQGEQVNKVNNLNKDQQLSTRPTNYYVYDSVESDTGCFSSFFSCIFSWVCSASHLTYQQIAVMQVWFLYFFFFFFSMVDEFWGIAPSIDVDIVPKKHTVIRWCNFTKCRRCCLLCSHREKFTGSQLFFYPPQ